MSIEMYRCPECRLGQEVPIKNDLCIKCHDRIYSEAMARDDETSRSIAREYRMTARVILDGNWRMRTGG